MAYRLLIKPSNQQFEFIRYKSNYIKERLESPPLGSGLSFVIISYQGLFFLLILSRSIVSAIVCYAKAEPLLPVAAV